MTAQRGDFVPLHALAAEAAAVPSWSSPPDGVEERDWRQGYAAAMADFADRLSGLLPALSGRDDHTEEAGR